MLNKNQETKKTDGAVDETLQENDSGEYGVEQLLAPEEDDLLNARKRSFYHYSREELKHKTDHFDAKESE